MTEQVTVTISGPTGSGKSAIYYEIMVALKAIGVPVAHGDPDEVARQMRGGETNSADDLALYNPTVTLIERNISRAPASASIPADVEREARERADEAVRDWERECTDGRVSDHTMTMIRQFAYHAFSALAGMR